MSLSKSFILISMLLFALQLSIAQEKNVSTSNTEAVEITKKKPPTKKTSKTSTKSNTKKISTNDIKGSLTEQVDIIIKHASTYKNKKIVPTEWMHHLKTTIANTTATTQNTIQSNEKQITALTSELSDAKNELKNLNIQLSSNPNKSNESFFGMQISKSIHHTILWVLIIAFSGLSFFFFFKFKNNISNTKKAKNDLKSLKKLFETHKKNAIETQQKLMRKLQDELNKKWSIKKIDIDQ